MLTAGPLAGTIASENRMALLASDSALKENPNMVTPRLAGAKVKKFVDENKAEKTVCKSSDPCPSCVLKL
jgi:hypothetical protein